MLSAFFLISKGFWEKNRTHDSQNSRLTATVKVSIIYSQTLLESSFIAELIIMFGYRIAELVIMTRFVIRFIANVIRMSDLRNHFFFN